MKTPTKATIKTHFAKAKEIRCLKLNTVIGVVSVKDFTYNEADNSWNGPAGIVCFWKDGTYAEITKKKCNPADCKNCEKCKGSRKSKL